MNVGEASDAVLPLSLMVMPVTLPTRPSLTICGVSELAPVVRTTIPEPESTK